MLLLLIGCMPDLLTVYSMGEGQYGVEPSTDCCLAAFVVVLLLVFVLFVQSIASSNR